MSTLYQGGTTEEQEHAAYMYYYLTSSATLEDVITPLWKSSNGAALSFLVCAADRVESPGPPENAKCDEGDYFDASTLTCEPEPSGCEDPPVEDDVAPAVEDDYVIVV